MAKTPDQIALLGVKGGPTIRQICAQSDWTAEVAKTLNGPVTIGRDGLTVPIT